MTLNRPLWLPEDAREIVPGEGGERRDPNYVTYLAPDCSVREYIASDKEIAFYKRAFYG